MSGMRDIDSDNLLRARIALASLKGINRMNAERLLDMFGYESLFFELSENELSARMGKKIAIFDSDYRRKVYDMAAMEVEFIRQNSIRPLFFTDEDYPSRLNLCDDAPPLLYAIGNCNLNDIINIAIVGTRHATPYGIDFVNHLIADLKERIGQFCVISGMAYGIDAAAHRAALKNGIPTIGVLAHGLNTIYPASHRQLASDTVKKGGMLVTDYKSSDKIHKGNFLARNRIVAGMADCLIVVESAEKGGALATARMANDYSREVFAVPGRTSDIYSAGCNKLIANNQAQLLTGADFLIDACGWTRICSSVPQQKRLFNEPSPQEKAIIEFIIRNPSATVNDISVHMNIAIGTLMAQLIDMEFKDLIISIPGGRYQAANNSGPF